MTSGKIITSRRDFLLTAGATFALLPFSQQAIAASGLTDILARASDSALSKLAQPDAFFNDEDIRIGLPFVGGLGGGIGDLAGKASRLFGGSKKADLFSGLTRKLNDVGGVAAGEAKPIFRQAIDGLSLNDAPDIVSKNDGATQYLRSSASSTLTGKLRPLVDDSMSDVGAYDELDRLSRSNSLIKSAGITPDSLGKSVTEQAMNGMFAYIANEEANFRANPIKNVNKLLGGFLK